MIGSRAYRHVSSPKNKLSSSKFTHTDLCLPGTVVPEVDAGLTSSLRAQALGRPGGAGTMDKVSFILSSLPLFV